MDKFLRDLLNGAVLGVVAGTIIYGLCTALAIVEQVAGIQVSTWLGGVTNFTVITIPKIFAWVGYSLIDTQGVCYLNELTSIGTG